MHAARKLAIGHLLDREDQTQLPRTTAIKLLQKAV